LTPKLFISQSTIDAWVAADQADVAGDVLTLRGVGGALRLAAASLFRSVSAGSDEAQKLLGRVKAEEAIASLGGEVYLTSVILGETAYEVDPGFLATPAPPEAAPVLVKAVAGLGDTPPTAIG
jgi:hypothetical protein